MPNCIYCGNNPTSHFLTKVTESYLIALQPVNRVVTKLGFTKAYFMLGDGAASSLIFLFRALGLAKYESPEKITIPRAKVLAEEAKRRGIKMEVLTVLGKPMDIYRAHVKGEVLNFEGLPRPQGASNALLWMDDKIILKRILMQAGVAVPRGESVTNFLEALKVFNKLEKPVIVKPRLGSRGRHTTTFVYTPEQLKKAFNIAKQLCHWLVIEEHLTGSVYRGTVINGKVVGVLVGDPPRITGDGKQRIKELVAIKNATKDLRVGDVKLTAELEYFLGRSKLSTDSILAAGKTIDLSEKIGVSYGGSSEELMDSTHPEIISILETAAKAVNDPIIGFDFIIADHTKDPKTQKWGIIECNGQPFINLHHDPLLGVPKNVAARVWDLFE